MPPGGKKKSAPPPLFYIIKQGDGDIDQTGKYTAPETKDNLEVVVEIHCSLPGVDVVEVTIMVEGIKSSIEIFPKKVILFSGQTVQFSCRSKTGKEAQPTWSCDLDHGIGSIDCSGLFTGPAIIAKDRVIKITLTDRNSGDTDQAEIHLKAVRFAETKEEIVARAGMKKCQLPIRVYNDPAGIGNFSCMIKSRPAVGRVEDGGMYYPPPRIDKPYNIEVEATSILDKTVKHVRKFRLDFPLCGKMTETGNCDGNIIANGVCDKCGQAATFGAYFAQKIKAQKETANG